MPSIRRPCRQCFEVAPSRSTGHCGRGRTPCGRTTCGLLAGKWAEQWAVQMDHLHAGVPEMSSHNPQSVSTRKLLTAEILSYRPCGIPHSKRGFRGCLDWQCSAMYQSTGDRPQPWGVHMDQTSVCGRALVVEIHTYSSDWKPNLFISTTFVVDNSGHSGLTTVALTGVDWRKGFRDMHPSIRGTVS